MRATKRAVFEFLIIGVMGVALGFGANAIRAKGAIDPNKNYFDMSVPKATKALTVDGSGGSRAQPQAPTLRDADTSEFRSGAADSRSRSAAEAATNGYADGLPMGAAEKSTAVDPAPQIVATPAAAEQAVAAKPKHDFQMIDFQGVVAAFNDPDTPSGLNVFVDARNDDHFAEGRIPGAVQCDPYEQNRYLADVLARTSAAEKVIVYCNGGDCEDSIFMCRDLIMAGVSFESVYLYEGGWKEWLAKGMPVEKGE